MPYHQDIQQWVTITVGLIWTQPLHRNTYTVRVATSIPLRYDYDKAGEDKLCRLSVSCKYYLKGYLKCQVAQSKRPDLNNKEM